MAENHLHAKLLDLINSSKIKVGIIGLGYVGLPISIATTLNGLYTIGFDIDPAKSEAISEGKSYLKHIKNSDVAKAVNTGQLEATDNFERLSEPDVLVICVPTPLTQHREPDLSYLTITAETIAKHLRHGQVIILESTTYPGTTDEVMRPILEKSGLGANVDFFLAFSPEREDPGNKKYSTSTIPKVVGADTSNGRDIAEAFYSIFVDEVVTVPNTRTAEMVKLTENIFRSVNIALVNELKTISEPMGINIWDVIEAAATKPFGFMPFYPGPGLGGHCIPIDPFYLSWKAKEYDLTTRFIELAGEINTSMPYQVIEKLARALDSRLGKGMTGSKILIGGIAYKKNIDDMRESPALKIIEILEARGAEVAYFDPFVPTIPLTREHAQLAERKSVAWQSDISANYDAVLIVTDHDDVDYAALVENASLVLDTRNVCKKSSIFSDKIVLA